MEELKERILIVDDNPLNREILVRVLRRHGYQPFEVASGQEAIDILVIEEFDLILLDVMMPEVDGLTVLNEVRKSSSITDLPIIMVTARAKDHEILEALKCGANDYITKPVHLAIAIARIEIVLAWKKSHDELRETKLKADLASKSKSEFLSNMSHEIRTPMNSIVGMADLLSGTQLGNEQRNYIQTIIRASDGLLAVINNILDLSKVEEGQMEFVSEEFELSELLESVMSVMEPLASKKEIRFNLSISTDVAAIYKGAVDSIRQVLINLLGNAIKFTKEGGVDLIVSLNGEDVQFCIRDTGIGISQDKIDSIFDSFTQADDFITREFGGTGLGLTISKKLIHLQGGKVWIESEKGVGSKFYVTLPGLVKVGETKALQSKDMTTNGIYIVKNTQQLNSYLLQLLKSEGVEVEIVSSILEIQKTLENMKVDYLFISSEVLEDIEFSKEVAGLERLDVAMVCIRRLDCKLLAAERFGEDVIEITSPVTRASLAMVLRDENVSIREVRGDVVPMNKKTHTNVVQFTNIVGRRILLVDDSIDNRILIRQYLKGHEVVLTEAENGREALDKFKIDSFDIILMDIQMPIMDGLTATREIRSWESGEERERTPIVALSAHALSEEIIQSKKAGCDDYIVKPVKRMKFLETISEYLFDQVA